MSAGCLLRRWMISAGLTGLTGIVGLCGCQPASLLLLLPQPDVEVPLQSPPYLLDTGDAPQVYLLLGFRDVYSVGLIDLTEQINAQGISARWLNDSAWLPLLEEVREAHAEGTLRGDLVFVGHSFGGDDAVNLARRLDASDIPVRLIVLVDATSPAPIPPNVDYCYHVFKPTLLGDLFPNSFAGNPAEAEPDNTHTVIHNEIVSIETMGPEAARIDHFNIDIHPLIHQLVIDKIREIARPSAGKTLNP